MLFHFDDSMEDLEIGETIDDFAFDKQVYDKAFSRYLAANVVHVSPSSSAALASAAPAITDTFAAAATDTTNTIKDALAIDPVTKDVAASASGMATDPVTKDSAATDVATDPVRKDVAATDMATDPVTKDVTATDMAITKDVTATDTEDVVTSTGVVDMDVTKSALPQLEEDEEDEKPVDLKEVEKLKALLEERSKLLESVQGELESVQGELDNTNRLYKNYQQRKQGEMRKLKEQSTEPVKRLREEKEAADNAKELAKAAAMQSESDLKRAKQELSATKDRLTTVEEAHAPAAVDEAHRINPRNGYHKLLALITDKFNEVIADRRLVDLQAKTSKVFEFVDQGRTITFTDKTAISLLENMIDAWIASKEETVIPPSVSYQINGNKYTAEIVKNEGTTSSHSLDQIHIKQTNIHTNVARRVLIREEKKSLKHLLLESLFGEECTIELPLTVIHEMLSEYRFDAKHKTEMYLPLAEFGDVMSTISGFDAKYVTNGEKPTNPKATYFASHADVSTGQEFNSQLLVKPFALHNWLRLAEARGLHKMVVVCHGASQQGIDGIRNDSWGFDMTMAGKQGQAFGNGLYVGLSPHATLSYNTSHYPRGSYILGLLLKQDDQGWQHHHQRQHNNGHFTTGYDEKVAEHFSSEDKIGKLYHTIQFNPLNHMDNACCVHSPDYVLPLGVMRSFDPYNGWMKDPKY